ncbi:MAG: L-threonylcarbamoyladenylate synthase, partial [Oscillospiraceae bacterium]
MKTCIFKDDILPAGDILRAGGLVAVPTETVYGLAANGFDEKAVESIYEVKGRPENKPISLMVSGAKSIDGLCESVPKSAFMLADCFWPGALTIVLKAKPCVPSIVRAGGETVGLRCPDHPQTLELLRSVS